MRYLIIIMVLTLAPTPSFAAISTATNLIDANFVGAEGLYPVDLDNDGDIDLVGTANAGNEVAWWENNGSQTFTKWSIDAAFNGANSVFVIDIDTDGDLDILATGGNSVTWWENLNRDGTAPNAAYPAIANWANQWDIDAAFNGAEAIYATDMDQDGDIDVLAAGSAANSVTWWENLNRDATAPNAAYPAIANWANQWDIDAAFNGANSILAIDMDKDGDIDVLSTAGTGAGALNDLSWWENNGTSTRNNWTEYTIDAALNGAASVYVCDLDFDGDLDVMAAATAGNDVSWWENDGIPRQSGWTENLINGNSNGANFVYAFDIDRDGDKDVLATAGIDNDIAWWENDADRISGNIAFEAELKVEDFFRGASSVWVLDMDLDGDNDIVAAADVSDDIVWWESDGTPLNGGWTTHTIENNFDGVVDIFVIDLDLDGDFDIVAAATNADELAWWENDGSLAFAKRSIDNTLNGANSVFVIDLDSDGDLDLLATAGLDDDLFWWANDGTPANGGWIKSAIDTAFDGANNLFCVDIDFDGDIDILGTAENADDVAWWENSGAEIFTKRFVDDNFNGAAQVKSADMDQDGDLDVVACGYNGNIIAWWANDGTPANGGWIQFTVDGSVSGPRDINIVDIDQDGDSDIAASLKVGDDITWWENDGTPLNGGWVLHGVDTNFDGAISLFAADLDRDGEIDIAAAAEQGFDISWWPNGGAEAVPPPEDTAGPLPSLDFTLDVLEPGPKAFSTDVLLGDLGLETEEEEGDLQEIDVKCFIATAAYGTTQADEIITLCRYRDKYILTTIPGKFLVDSYYKISPPLSRFIRRKTVTKCAIRVFIKTILVVLPHE